MNYNEAKELLHRYLKARIPVIIVNTVEKNRVINMLNEIGDEESYSFSSFSLSQGMVDLKTNQSISDEKTIMSALDYISSEVKFKENGNYVLSDIADINISTSVSRFLLDIINNAEKQSGVIVLITNDNVWNNIARLGINLSLAYPDEEELTDIIKNTIKPYVNQLTIDWDQNDYKKAAQSLQGLSEMEVKNIISSLIVTGKITKEDLKELKFTKKTLFNNMPGLEAIDVDDDFEIAGLENLQEWIYEKKNLLDPSYKEELNKRGIIAPRGVLLTGVPGCGKSLCSKAIASIFNVPLYRLDLATVQGEYVGQSERQLKEALEAAEYVSPCVLWIDEIEKGFKDTNSSVTTKMIGQFLFWLQECDKPVFVVASSNSVEDLPAELIRKGRFDEIFFVDLPNKKERLAVISLYAKKYLKVNFGEELLSELVDLTEGFSSADIEATMRQIAYKLIANKNTKLTEDLIKTELKKVVSLTKTNPEKIEKIRQWGKERAVKASRED